MDENTCDIHERFGVIFIVARVTSVKNEKTAFSTRSVCRSSPVFFRVDPKYPIIWRRISNAIQCLEALQPVYSVVAWQDASQDQVGNPSMLYSPRNLDPWEHILYECINEGCDCHVV